MNEMCISVIGADLHFKVMSGFRIARIPVICHLFFEIWNGLLRAGERLTGGIRADDGFAAQGRAAHGGCLNSLFNFLLSYRVMWVVARKRMLVDFSGDKTQLTNQFWFCLPSD